MNGQIIKIIFNNLIYFTLICIVYLRNALLAVFCLTFIVFTIYIESKIFIFKRINSDSIIDALQYLNQRLRIGDSPGYAYQKMLKSFGKSSLEFKNDFIKSSPYYWMVFEQLKSEMDFNYETFQNQLDVITTEIAWREQISGVFDKSQIQINIMKHLPLIIETVFLHNQSVNTFIYICSICLLMLSNVLTYNNFKEIL